MNICSATQISFVPTESTLPLTLPASQFFDVPPSPNMLNVELLEKVDAFSHRKFGELMSEAFNQGIPYYIAFNQELDNQLRPYDAFNLIAHLSSEKDQVPCLPNLANGRFNSTNNFRIYRVTKGNPGTLRFFSNFNELESNFDHKLKFIYAAAPITTRPKVIAQSSFYRGTTINNPTKKLKWFLRGSNFGSHEASLELFVVAQENMRPDLAKIFLARAIAQTKNCKSPAKAAKITEIARAYITEMSPDEISRLCLK